MLLRYKQAKSQKSNVIGIEVNYLRLHFPCLHHLMYGRKHNIVRKCISNDDSAEPEI